MRSCRAVSRTCLRRDALHRARTLGRADRRAHVLGFRAMHARLAEARRELPRAIRIAVAAGLAWWIARMLGADRPVFAALVPLVAIRDEPYAALSLSLGRMLGVIVGVLLGIVVVALFGVSTSAVAFLLVAGLADRALAAHRPRAEHADRDLGPAARRGDVGRRHVRARAHLGDRRSARSPRSSWPRSCCRPNPLREAQRRLTETIDGAGGRPGRCGGHARARRPVAARAARARRRARARLRPRRRGSAEGAARAALEPAAARLAHATRGRRAAPPAGAAARASRCAGWPATSPASRTARTCATSGPRPRRASAADHRGRRRRPRPRRSPARASRARSRRPAS